MKTFDAVVLGSTGFAGRQVCKHIVDNYHGKGLKWAMAGRNRAKLEEMRASLAAPGQDLSDVQIVEADVNDPASLDALAASASVVITMVGPYAHYGRPVVQACIDNEAHYCDITAEAQYIQRTMFEFDDEAKAKGVRIVHSCGLDSVPSEVMTLMAAHHMATEHNSALGTVTYVCEDMMGGFSGGTIQSFVNYMKDRNQDPAFARLVSHAYALIPKFWNLTHGEAEALPDKGGKWSPQWSEAAQQWGGPFVMHFHNEKIVRMSNALLGWKFGKDMKYSERLGTNFLSAVLASMVMNVCAGLVAAAAQSDWFRAKLPQPGDGPTQEELEAGYYKLSCWALPEGCSDGILSPARVHSQFADMHRDGGYLSCSRMVLECALCMIPENEKLLAQDPYASTCPAGVLAPSAAFGLVLHDRLRNADFEISVEDAPVRQQARPLGGASATAPRLNRVPEESRVY